MTVIVAGAGLAGLTAARALARAGRRVVVLDARPRVGGRVLTAREGLLEGSHGELGGEFIEREQKGVRALCDELGLRLVRVLRAGFTHRFRSADGEYRVSRTRPWSELEDLVAPLIRRYTGAQGSARHRAVRDIAAWSLRNWLRERGATPEHHSLAAGLRGFFLADPDDLSVLPLVEQLANGGSPAQAEMYRIEGGNDRLPQALARDAGARILLEHRVTAVSQSDRGVLVSATDAAGAQQQFEGDAAVLTLPASTLRDVTFEPGLPEAQWRAIRSLRYGCATKALVQTPRDPFRGRARAFATDTELGAFWDGSDGERERARDGAKPGRFILTFLAGGSASRGLQDRVRRGGHALLSDLCWLEMPGAPVDAVLAATWEDDSWARGGYAYFDPAFDPAWRPLLARRAGRIVFAGEHTSERWQGYMNGAVESGLRAAQEIM